MSRPLIRPKETSNGKLSCSHCPQEMLSKDEAQCGMAQCTFFYCYRLQVASQLLQMRPLFLAGNVDHRYQMYHRVDLRYFDPGVVRGDGKHKAELS